MSLVGGMVYLGIVWIVAAGIATAWKFLKYVYAASNVLALACGLSIVVAGFGLYRMSERRPRVVAGFEIGIAVAWGGYFGTLLPVASNRFEAIYNVIGALFLFAEGMHRWNKQ